jgi:hypothetical protein
MPYLSCRNCDLTVYNPPTVAAPERCPRCAVPLSVDPGREPTPSATELADLLRRRAAGRGRAEPGAPPEGRT